MQLSQFRYDFLFIALAESLFVLRWLKIEEVSLRFRGTTGGILSIAIEVEEGRQLFPHVLHLLLTIHVLGAVQVSLSIL